MSILGVQLSEHTFVDVRRLLGPTDVRDNGGDAAANATAACYVGSDGTTVVLISSGEMGGGWLTMFQLVARPGLANFSGDYGGGYTVPLDKRPRCSRLPKLSRRTSTPGGLRLGMTRGEVLRILGSPKSGKNGALWFHSETELHPSPKQIDRLTEQWGDGDYATVTFDRWIITEFEQGKLVAVRAEQNN